MSTSRLLLLSVLLGTAPVAPAVAQDCSPSGGIEFVCGPKNAEDLVRVPSTPWIVASGMAAGAGFYLID